MSAFARVASLRSRWALGLVITTAMLDLWPVSVQASVVEYDFHTTSTTGGLPLSYAPVLRVDSSVLPSGLNFRQECTIPVSQFCHVTSGSMAGFVGLTDATLVDFVLAPSLTFNLDGTLTGSIFNEGLNQDLNESGTGLNWSGTLLSDAFLICGAQNVCTFQGFWLETGMGTAVPEPAALTVFATALAGLGLLRRRYRKNA